MEHELAEFEEFNAFMGDFGLFEEFLDDFLSVSFSRCSLTIWLQWRKCLQVWWVEAAEGARKAAVEGRKEEAVLRWLKWTKCTRKWWWKPSKTSAWTKTKKNKTNSSWPRTNFSLSSSGRKMSRRKRLERREDWSASMMDKSSRRMKFSCILASITWNSSRNGS